MNALCAMQVPQGGGKGRLSKVAGKDKGKVVGKVFSTQIPIPILLKPMQTMKITTTLIVVVTPHVKVDVSKI